MQKKVTWILCSLAILACYGCGDDSGSADPAENKGCTFEAAYCDGNVLHTCLNGDEKTETCTGTCNSDQGKCIPGENDKIPECGENRHYDETAGECVDNEPAEHTCDDPNQHYDETAGECVDNAPPEHTCDDPNQHYDETAGECVDNEPPEHTCDDPNQHYDETAGECVDNAPAEHTCDDPHQHYDEASGECVDPSPKDCDLEQYWDESEKSCINVCPCNQVYDKNTAKCVENNPFSKLSSKEQQRQLQHALKETAMAFYRKGDNIQYEDARRSMYIEPEVTTSQQVSYLTCSGFVHAVFRQALNIKLPLGSIQYGAYGHSFSNNKENKDIIYYLEGDNLKEVIEKAQTKNDLLEKIQPGDVIAYHQFHYDKEKKKTTANSGHVVYIYDLIKDNKGTTIDARILHSNSSFEYVDPPNDDHRTTKLSASLSWNNKEDDEENNKLNGNLIDTPTGVHEGTIQKTLFSKVLNYDSTKNSTQFVVMRPTNNPKSYKHIQVSNYKDEDYPKWATNTEITDIDYNITDAAYCRMKYHDIEIEKTLDVHPGSTVEPGQDLTYTIKIINHSDNNYDPIYITEELSEYVSLKDAGGGTLYEKTNDNNKDDKDKVAWYIPTIKAGETHETTYTVTVKNDPGLLGKVIKSNGAVAKIKSKEIVNTIAYNLCTQQIKKLKDNYELISQEGKLKGLEAIQETYKVLSYDIPLTGMKLGALYLQEGMKEKDFPEAFKGDTPQAPYYDKGKPHYDENKNEALLISRYQESNVQKALVLNTKHALAGMVLNHYYGGVSSTYSINQNKKVYTEKAAVKSYENSTGSQTRVDRQVQIYPETLRDGDILIYANTLDTITKEDGTYAYIFLDGKFQGVNSAVNAPKELAVKNGVAPKYFTEHKKAQVSMIERFGDMPKIFGKDFYVILRPALTMKTGCKDD